MDAEHSTWERDAIKKLLHEGVKEQQRRRRWGIFFKITYLFVFISLVSSLLIGQDADVIESRKPHVGIVDIDGAIMPKSDSSADNIVSGLRAAFKGKNSVAIILRVNSPGGTPVQSAMVFDELMRLRSKYPKKKVYAVCTDICASGAYYIASAADEIYANPSSLVGSIGVKLSSFGFVGAFNKLGIERRLLSAGNNKGFLDPFRPLTLEDRKFAQEMLDDVHAQFIAAVKKGRGKKIKENKELFSGLAWTGAQAKKLGLIDDFGSPGYVAREVIENDTYVDYTVRPVYFKRFASLLGNYFANGFTAYLAQPPLN